MADSDDDWDSRMSRLRGDVAQEQPPVATAPESGLAPESLTDWDQRMLRLGLPEAVIRQRQSEDQEANLRYARRLAPTQGRSLLENDRAFTPGGASESPREAARHYYPFVGATRDFVTQVAYGRARRRYEEGAASQADLEAIATFEHQQQIHATRSTSEQVGHGIAGAATWLGEAYLGGSVLGSASLFGGAATRAAGTAAPTLGRAALSYTGRAAATAISTPSAWMPEAGQRNLEAGRQAYDPRGFPAPIAMAMLQNGVYGAIGAGPADRIAGTTIQAYAARGITRVGTGMATQHLVVEPLAQAISSVLPDTYKLQTGNGLLMNAFEGKWGEAGKQFAVSLATMAAFAALHEVQTTPRRGPGRVLTTAQDAMNDFNNGGPDVQVLWTRTNGPKPRPSGPGEMIRFMSEVDTAVVRAHASGNRAQIEGLPDGPVKTYALTRLGVLDQAAGNTSPRRITGQQTPPQPDGALVPFRGSTNAPTAPQRGPSQLPGTAPRRITQFGETHGTLAPAKPTVRDLYDAHVKGNLGELATHAGLTPLESLVLERRFGMKERGGTPMSFTEIAADPLVKAAAARQGLKMNGKQQSEPVEKRAIAKLGEKGSVESLIHGPNRDQMKVERGGAVVRTKAKETDPESIRQNRLLRESGLADKLEDIEPEKDFWSNIHERMSAAKHPIDIAKLMFEAVGRHHPEDRMAAANAILRGAPSELQKQTHDLLREMFDELRGNDKQPASIRGAGVPALQESHASGASATEGAGEHGLTPGESGQGDQDAGTVTPVGNEHALAATGGSETTSDELKRRPGESMRDYVARRVTAEHPKEVAYVVQAARDQVPPLSQSEITESIARANGEAETAARQEVEGGERSEGDSGENPGTALAVRGNAGQPGTALQPGTSGGSIPGAPSVSATIINFAKRLLDENAGDVNFEQLVRALVRGVMHLQDNLTELGGSMFPRAARVSHKLSDALAAHVAGPEWARTVMPSWFEKVLGKTPISDKDATLLGATLVEFRLRNIENDFNKQGQDFYNQALAIQATNPAKARELQAKGAEAFTNAMHVKTLVGGANSPLKNAADYQASMASPLWREFAKNYKPFSDLCDDFMRQARGVSPGAPLPNTSQVRGLTMNLWNIPPGTTPPSGSVAGSRGNVRAFKLGTPSHMKQAMGTGDNYEMDVRKIMEHTLGIHVGYATKQQAYRTAQSEGAGAWINPSAPRVGKLADLTKEQLFTDLAPKAGTQQALRGETAFAVFDPEAAKDFRKAFDPDLPNKYETIQAVGNMLNQANILSGAEVLPHISNLIMSSMNEGMWRGMMQTALDATTAKGIDSARDRIGELVKIGVSRPSGNELAIGPGKGILHGTLGVPAQIVAKGMHLIRDFMMLSLDKSFDHHVKQGNYDDTPFNRREYINKGIYQYNIKGQNRLVRWLRDSGFGPFATAATGAWGGAKRAVTGGHGLPAKTLGREISMRAHKLAKIWLGVVGAGLALNHVLWGDIFGDDDTPIGAIKIGMDSEGKTSYIDHLAWIGLRRGARELGLLAILEGSRRDRPRGAIIDQALGDFGRSVAHAAEGPPIQFAHTVMFGEDMLGRHLTEQGHESTYEANLEAALWNVNPAVGEWSGHNQSPLTSPHNIQESLLHSLSPFSPRTSDSVGHYYEALRDAENARHRGPDFEARYRQLKQFEHTMQQLSGRRPQGQPQLDDESRRELLQRRREMARRALSR